MGASINITIIFILSAFTISILLNRLLLKFSKNLGTRKTGEVRFASTAKPSLGGITFYIVFLLSFISALFIFPDYLLSNTKQTAGLFMATTLGFILGFADDAYNTNPALKFMGQTICGIILVFSDVFIEIIPTEVNGGFTVNALFTIIWVIGIMNSINMLDNMDAITTTISISILIITVLTLKKLEVDDAFMKLILYSTIACLLGFLIYNWHPAKMYMGDTGSQFLGVLLAFLAIKYFWNHRVTGPKELFQLKQFLVPLLAFIIPIIDTTTVFIRRIGRGQSPLKGGIDHTTHHLAFLGLPVPIIAIVFFIINTLSIIGISMVLQSASWKYIHTYMVIGYFLFLFIGFQFMYELGAKNKPTA